MRDPEDVQPVAFLFVSLVLTMFLVLVTQVWSYIWQCVRSKREIVPRDPRFEVPWGGVHIVLVLLLQLVLLAVAGYLVRNRIVHADSSSEQLPTTPSLADFFAFSVAELVALVLGLTLILVTSPTSARDLGLPNSWREARSDFRLGALASVAVIIPILVLQWILTYAWIQWNGAASPHPLLKAMEEQPSLRGMIAFTAMAMFVAPLVEEFFFRVLFQGWLEKPSLRRIWSWLPRWLWGLMMTRRSLLWSDESIKSDKADLLEGAEAELSISRSSSTTVSFPILVSAGLFAAAHAGSGPDPIPIFLLALALGYLYRQTHRIMPSLALHVCFNGYSVIIVALEFLRTGKFTP